MNVIAPVLTEVGYSDLAYTLLLQDQMPSWLYSVKNRATTVWKRWNSYSVTDGFGPVSMNSFNHYSYGAIAEWMYGNMIGISNDPKNPGFKHTILQPTVDNLNRITWAKGAFDSVHGTIRSDWEVNDNQLIYNATVPANTTATLYLPAVSANVVTESGKPATEANGIKFIEFKDGKAVYELQSGSYHFLSAVGYKGTASLNGPNLVGENESFNFTYHLDGVSNVSAQDITIRYDSDRFEFVKSEALNEGTSVEATSKDAGTVRLIVAGLGVNNTINGSADVLHLTFKSKKQSGTGTIELFSVKTSNGQGEVTQIGVSGKSVTMNLGILNKIYG